MIARKSILIGPQAEECMTDCDLDTPVPDWIIEHPETLAVFQEYGIDYSCGGKSLRYACEQRGVNPDEVLDALRSCLSENR